MKKFIYSIFLVFGLSFGQTCDGMFSIYDSCYDANNCDEAYIAIYELSTSGGLTKTISEKLAKVCKSSCQNKKSNVRKLTKEEFQSVFCPTVKK